MKTVNSLICLIAMLLISAGCTTTAAKKALEKPAPRDAYTAFDKEASEPSKRKAATPAAVKEDTDPEEAVDQLVNQMKKGGSYAVSAEEQLKIWGTKQGVSKSVVSKVRLLMKDENVEVKAPALRLTILFGGPESTGDLIEALADKEYGIRDIAFRSVRTRTKRDFGYEPGAGEVARIRAVDEYRRWWQMEKQKVATQPPSVYEGKPVSEPKIVGPKD
jgi:hypothetical protein